MSEFAPFNPYVAPPPLGQHSRFNPKVAALFQAAATPAPSGFTPLLPRVPPPHASTLLPPNKMALTAEEYAALPNYINIPWPSMLMMTAEERLDKDGEGLLDLPADALDWDTLLGADAGMTFVAVDDEGEEELDFSLFKRSYSGDTLTSQDSGYKTGRSFSWTSSSFSNFSDDAAATEEGKDEDWISTAVTVASEADLDEEEDPLFEPTMPKMFEKAFSEPAEPMPMYEAVRAFVNPTYRPAGYVLEPTYKSTYDGFFSRVGELLGEEGSLESVVDGLVEEYASRVPEELL